MCTNYQFVNRKREQLEIDFGPFTESDWRSQEPLKSHEREIYPAYEGIVIHRGSNLLARYRWGFDNFIDPKRLLVNAKSETVHELRTFAKAFRETRCLIPADGYYEYHQSDPVGKKRRYVFKVGDGLFAFAGLWQERGGVRSYTMITTTPNDVAGEIHNRMPVVLAKSDYERWLDPTANPDDLLALLVPWIGKMTATEAPKANATAKRETEPNAAKRPTKEKKSEKGGLFDSEVG